MIYKSENAVVCGDVRLSDDVSIWHYVTVRGDEAPIVVDCGTNIQDGCVLHADPGYPLTVGKGVTVGHRAVVHGCTIEDDVLIGMGAIILNGAHIGSGSIIGAGAVVLEGSEIPSRSLVVGLPAKVRASVSDAQFADIQKNAGTYVALAKTSLNAEENRC